MRVALPSPVQRLATFAVVASLVAAVGCTAPPPPAPVELVFASGDRTWGVVGGALAGEYGRRLPNVRVAQKALAGLDSRVDALQTGALDLAFVDAETAYRTYKGGSASLPEPHGHLRAIAVLFQTVVHILVRADLDVASIHDLRGRRINVGRQGGYPDQAARVILASYGLNYDDVRVSFEPEDDPLEALRQARVDALVFWTPPYSPVIAHILDTLDVRLLPVDRNAMAAAQNRNHFLKSMIIPAATYANQNSDLQTVGDDVLLLCREGLPDQVVHDLTAALFDSVPELVKAHPVAGSINPDRGPTASIPLHPGAAQFYRERELLRY